MPGGLVRVAGPDGQVVSMQRGGRSKDAWVLSDGPVDTFSMLRPRNQPVVRVDGPVAPLGQLRLVSGSLQFRPPMGIKAGPLPLDVLGRRQAQLDPGWCQRL